MKLDALVESQLLQQCSDSGVCNLLDILDLLLLEFDPKLFDHFGWNAGGLLGLGSSGELDPHCRMIEERLTYLELQDPLVEMVVALVRVRDHLFDVLLILVGQLASEHKGCAPAGVTSLDSRSEHSSRPSHPQSSQMSSLVMLTETMLEDLRSSASALIPQ